MKLNLKLFLLSFIIFVDLVWANDQLSIWASNLTIHKEAIIKFNFISDAEIKPDAEITIVFPKTYDLSMISMASSLSITGGFIVSTHADTVRLARTGIGNSVVANNNCELSIASAILLSQDESFRFMLIIHHDDEIFDIIEKDIRIQLLQSNQ